MNATMTSLALTGMMPEHLLLLGIVLLLTMDILGRWSRAAVLVAVATTAAAAATCVVLAAAGTTGDVFAGMVSLTPQTLLAKAVVLGIAVPILMMSRDDFEGGEFPSLLLSSLYGVCLLVSSDSALITFLGIELMSIPVYALIVMGYRRPQSAEASLKYLVLGGTASAMFLMGVMLLFNVSGSMSVSAFANALSATDLMSRAAVVLVLLAFFIKGAIVPFHAWAPDAYEGASITTTAYMATIVKAGVLFAALRMFGTAAVASPVMELLAVFALVSIVWGNLTAMRQLSFRRMIAYSSIAHAGYLFYALLGDGAGRLQAITFYVLAYGVLNVLAFSALPTAAKDGDRDALDQMRGLFHRQPFAALVIGMAMLSLAGLPPFPGFVAKFLIFKNVLAAGHPVYATLGLVGSYLGIYFYLRVIQLMFMSAPVPATPSAEQTLAPETAHWHGGLVEPVRMPVPATSGLARVASMLCVAAMLLLAIIPGWVLERF